MQITLTPATPAETRLIASFLQDLADLQEAPEALAPLAGKTPEVKATPTETTPRRSRSKKTEPQTEDPAAQTAVEAGAGQADAPVTETPSAPSAESSSNETAEAADEKIDHDSLRVLMGRCAQANKRNESVAIVKGYGYSGISAIKPEHFVEINAKLKGLLDA